MKRARIVFVAMSVCAVAIGVVFLLSACHSGPAASGDKTVTIDLDANATTGYTWSYTMDKDGILNEVSSDYKEKEHEKGMTGVGGTQEYVFEAGDDGTVTITFSYARSWETGVAPAETQTYTYTVKNGYITQES